jgi:hypothetical protein
MMNEKAMFPPMKGKVPFKGKKHGPPPPPEEGPEGITQTNRKWGNKDKTRKDKKRMVRRIERNWGNCIMCSQCFLYCITKKGIMLDKDFDKSTTDPADFIDTQDKELVMCEHCGSPITAVDHIRWCMDKLGELSYANQTFMVARHKSLNLVKEGAPRDDARALDRGDFIRALCPDCRAAYILSDEWGES